MKCSFDPPLFAVALQKKGFTHTLIRESKEFVIAVANQSLEEAVQLFGTTHGNEIDKFSIIKLQTQPAQFVHVPLLTQATINFECRLVNEVEAGDHIIFIGKVLTAYSDKNKKVLFHLPGSNGTRIFKEF